MKDLCSTDKQSNKLQLLKKTLDYIDNNDIEVYKTPKKQWVIWDMDNPYSKSYGDTLTEALINYRKN